MATKSNPKTILRAVISKILARSLGEPTLINADTLKITPNLMSGEFLSRSGSMFEFSVIFTPNDKMHVTYVAKRLARQDMAIAGERYDRRKPKCEKGTLCGDTCIEKGEVCEVGKGMLPQGEGVRKIRQTAAAASTKPDKYTDMTIRELKNEARKQEVFKYSELDSSQLRGTLRTLESDPESQKRVYKTIRKKRARKQAVVKSLPKGSRKTFRQFDRIRRTAGLSNTQTMLLTGAALLGVSAGSYRFMRGRYKSTLSNSATLAMERARSVDTVKTKREGITFAVGGFKNNGGDAQRMKDLLTKPQDSSEGESWLANSQEIITVEHDSMNMGKVPGKGIFRFSGVVMKGMKKNFESLVRKRNDASVDIAAQLYAQGVANPDAQLNILTQGYGNQNVRAAGEILRQMKPPPGKRKGRVTGEQIFERLNIVNLGGPSFGFTNDKAWDKANYRTITSTGDNFSVLPKSKSEYIDTVRGDKVDDYLNNKDVRERLRESWGFYKDSLTGAEKAEDTRKKFDGRVKEAKTQYTRNIETATAEVDAIATAMSDTLPSGGTLPRKKAVQIAVGDPTMSAGQIQAEIRRASGLNKTQISALDKKQIHEAFDTSDNRANIAMPGDIEKGSIAYANFVGEEVYGKRHGDMSAIGTDNDSIRLAAMIRAHAMKNYQIKLPNDTFTRFSQPVNIVAYGSGGLKAREAMDMVIRLDKKNGTKFADQVNLVTIGTPSFHIADGKHPETNLMGDGDQWNNSPFLRGRGQTDTIKGIEGHDGPTYFRNAQVQSKIHAIATAGLDTRRQVHEKGGSFGGLNETQYEASQNSKAPKRPDVAMGAERWRKLTDEQKALATRKWVRSLDLFTKKQRKEEKYKKTREAIDRIQEAEAKKRNKKPSKPKVSPQEAAFRKLMTPTQSKAASEPGAPQRPDKKMSNTEWMKLSEGERDERIKAWLKSLTNFSNRKGRKDSDFPKTMRSPAWMAGYLKAQQYARDRR